MELEIRINSIFPQEFASAIKTGRNFKAKHKISKKTKKNSTNEPSINHKTIVKSAHAPSEVTFTEQASQSEIRHKKFQSVESVQLPGNAIIPTAHIVPPTRTQSHHYQVNIGQRKQSSEPKSTQQVNMVEFSLKKMNPIPYELSEKGRGVK